MRSVARLSTVATIGFGAFACGETTPEASPPPPFSIRDSAGIEIVENIGALWDSASAWRLSAEPVVRIGVVEGEQPYLFSGIVGLTRLDDGRIVALDDQSRELRFFDENGSFLLKAGGAGEGPGEFRSPGSLERLAGDTLQIGDGTVRNRYTPDGAFHSQERLRWVPDAKRHGDLYLECGGAPHFLGDDVIGCGATEPPGDPSLPDWAALRTRALVRFPITLERVDTIGTVSVRSLPLVLYENELVSLSKAYVPWAGFHFGGLPARLYTWTSTTYAIESRALDGTLERIVRRLDGRRAPTEKELTPSKLEVLSRDRTPMPPEARRRLARDTIDQLPEPDSISLLHSVFVDRENRIWGLRDEDRSAAESSFYDVFDPEGRYFGVVEFPARFTPFEIGRGYVLGVTKDDLDVEYVELYRIEGLGGS